MAQRLAFLTIAIGLVAICVLVGSTHDYAAYLSQWQITWAGHDPWAREIDGQAVSINAYGPGHLVFAPLVALHPFLPKAVLVLMVMAVFALVLRARATRDGFWRFAMLFPLAPLVLVSVTIFGNNDIVPALCLVLAVSAFAGGRSNWAGALIGVGALVKFYPLLFAAFLVARDGRISLRVPLVAAAVFAAGMGVSYAIWGDSVLSPFLFGQERHAKMLSILRFLSPLGEVANSGWFQHLLDHNSKYVLGVAALVALHGWLARLDWEITAVLGVLMVFAVYKVGHPQFYVTWVALLAWVLARQDDGPANRVAVAFLPVTAVLSLYQMVYLLSKLLTDDYLKGDWAVVRDYAALPFVAALLWGLFVARRDIFRPWRRPVWRAT